MTPENINNQADGDLCKQKISHITGSTLRDNVTQAMDDYFRCLDGEKATDVYHMVLTEVESALMASVLRYVDGNQSKAAECLGISRGTLLKKLTRYQLHLRKKRG